MEDVILRNLLKRYAVNGEVFRGVKLKPLEEAEKIKLFNAIKNISEPLYTLLNEIEGDCSLLQVYRKFLFCLASPSPVCSLLRPVTDVQLILKAIGKGVNLKENPTMWNLLHEKIPVLFEIMERYTMCISDKFIQLLAELWEIAISPFIDAHEDNNTEENDLNIDELSFFPSLKKYRNRGKFEMDNNRMKKGKSTGCQKRYLGHPSLLPGIFTMFCPHGKSCI